MLKKLFTNIWKQIAGLRKDCRGFVVMSTLAIFLFLFVLCASIYAVGETIHQRIKLQNACDAAAYSAAVVQADGLSRMAVVNRAMAWSYVQMTNRQMDYITYRWLKLTCKRFEEDKNNAKDYAEQLILAIDRELGWWAILEAVASGAINVIFEKHCDTGGHHKEHNGYSWWCGLEWDKENQIDMNQNNSMGNSFSEISDKLATSYLKNKIFTYDLINTTTTTNVTIIDRDPGNDKDNNPIPKQPSDWGYCLGKLIDHDKKNSYRLNQTLERINTQMETSMKMTAENVLKAMLKDNRYDSKSVLQDYYISIHIPHAENPYNAENENHSFFSPLRNTEVDERLFLQMQSIDNANQPLAVMFPILAGKGASHGLDQWFIRGTGIYQAHLNRDGENYSDTKNMEADNDKFCYAAQEANPTFDGTCSGWIINNDESKVRLLGTKRDEGALGIQRVYKDANLNEGRVGFWSKTKSNTEENVIKDACIVVNRGNHLFSVMDFLNAGWDAAKSFFGESGSGDEKGQETDEEDEEGDVSIENMDDLNKASNQNSAEKKRLKNENEKLKEDISLLEKQLSSADDATKKQIEESINKKQGTINSNNARISSLETEKTEMDNVVLKSPATGNQEASAPDKSMEKLSPGSILGEIGTSVINSLIGDFLDIDPSCDNLKGPFPKLPMCKFANDTTALYSEYRWASCKYYCLTKLWTWSICIAFGKDIYCDRKKKTIKKVGLIKFRGKGHGHYGWPKWFCGATPAHPGDGEKYFGISLDSFLKYFPPVYGNIDGTHGYMKNVLDMNKFMRPIKPLFGKNTTFTRNEYNSCAMFPDGSFRFSKGEDSHAGLIRGHARIYGDDKEIFDNRYVGAICKPWVLNERFFAGEGSIVVGAAMKHTNPFVQLFNFWNTKKDKGSYATGTETQKNAEKTVLSAFNIPEGNFMWTMSAARAGVRHRRRNGAFDQERQYQITYDSTSDAENLTYMSGPYVKAQDGNGWTSPEEWDSSYNKHALSRIYFPGQEQSPVWNGCPCGANSQQFKNMWNLCETDWDATLLPLRYAGQKASLYLEKEENEDHVNEQHDAFNSKNYSERRNLLGDTDHYKKIGNGKYWVWNGVATDNSSVLMSNPFISSGWKPANAPFFENLVMDRIPGAVSTGISTLEGLNLLNKIPTGKEEKTINILLKDKIL